MAKDSPQFVCQQCGYDTPKWMGQCPSCGTWNSLVEMKFGKEPRSKSKSRSISVLSEPVKLSAVKKEDYSKRFVTGIGELDRVLGGGIVPGMVTLVAGEPGIGKSTLLLQIASNFPKMVLYIAGEESSSQIAGRAARLGIQGQNITILEETDVDVVLEAIGQLDEPIGFLIVDSIQTMTTQDLSGGAGSIGQVRECAGRLASFAKRTGTPVFLVGHVTKDGSIAGPRVLEHIVDTVLWFEGERSDFLRILRAVKNRFGATDEVGIFSMNDKGLEEVANPSKFFLGEEQGVPGSATTVVLEGTRAVLVEIQALVVQTRLAFPKRMGQGIDTRRLELIVAVLIRRGGLPLWDYDILVKVTGGIEIRDPGADLAIALAIASSFKDKPLLPKTVAAGEVGLLGEIREVGQFEKRVKEARRLGFTNPITKRETRTISEAMRRFIAK
ncbi:MAG: DNA repair protein RadA [bacterium]|nr:DNA repair protein RadA [bacterium]